MSIAGAILMIAVLAAIFVAGIYEKVLRKEDLEKYKIAAYLHFKNGYVKPVYADEFYLGSGKNADVRIPAADSDVASVHAYIYRDGEYFWIQNIARNAPIYVKYFNEVVQIGHGKKNMLRNNSRIKIGKNTIVFKRGVM